MGFLSPAVIFLFRESQRGYNACDQYTEDNHQQWLVVKPHSLNQWCNSEYQQKRKSDLEVVKFVDNIDSNK